NKFNPTRINNFNNVSLIEAGGHSFLLNTQILPFCFEMSFEDPKICSSNGICISKDNCQCKKGFLGNKCEIHTCYNIQFKDTSACSSKGICKSLDQCECLPNHFGKEC